MLVHKLNRVREAKKVNIFTFLVGNPLKQGHKGSLASISAFESSVCYKWVEIWGNHGVSCLLWPFYLSWCFRHGEFDMTLSGERKVICISWFFHLSEPQPWPEISADYDEEITNDISKISSGDYIVLPCFTMGYMSIAAETGRILKLTSSPVISVQSLLECYFKW